MVTLFVNGKQVGKGKSPSPAHSATVFRATACVRQGHLTAVSADYTEQFPLHGGAIRRVTVETGRLYSVPEPKFRD